MTTISISHSDWELLEDADTSLANFSSVSPTAFQISVDLAGRAAVFTVSGSFTNLPAVGSALALSNLSGTVSGIRLSIDGIEQLNATGLSLDASEVIGEAASKIHDLVELAIGGEVDIEGSADDDHLSGSGGDDSLSGGLGDDDLFGDLGDDSLNGGIGDDSLSGGSGHDSLYGGGGNDTLNGGTSTDLLAGGSGDDRYYVNSDLDWIGESSSSTGGYDTEYSSVSETLLATGVERLILTGSASRGSGNGGNNALVGNTGNNLLSDDIGDDSLNGGAGDDSLNGGSGHDSLYGGAGDDSLNGGSSDDVLVGGGGNDRYYVNSDLDRISESSASTGGYDTEYSSVNESLLATGVERLVLTRSAVHGSGNGGNNALFGNAVDNVLSGGSGNDRLTGGRGADTLHGGGGDDLFDFNSLAELGRGTELRDCISGFVRGDDHIDLSTIDANAALAGNQAFRYVSSFGSDATGQVRYAGGVVTISTDADRSAEYEIQLIGVAPASLNATDFHL